MLESHLGSSGDEHDSAISTIPCLLESSKGKEEERDIPGVGPNHLNHQKASIREDRVPSMGLCLEPSVGSACPLIVSLSAPI